MAEEQNKTRHDDDDGDRGGGGGEHHGGQDTMAVVGFQCFFCLKKKKTSCLSCHPHFLCQDKTASAKEITTRHAMKKQNQAMLRLRLRLRLRLWHGMDLSMGNGYGFGIPLWCLWMVFVDGVLLCDAFFLP